MRRAGLLKDVRGYLDRSGTIDLWLTTSRPIG
jgi:hypothetical protein